MDRRHYIGGTDIGPIFGVSPWKTALDLYEEKTAETYIEPEIEPEREKLYRRGKKLEPWVMELLEEERGITIFRKNQRYQDAEFPWMACEIDFEYNEEQGLCNGDVKTVSPFAAGDWGEQGTDEIPLYYCLQFMFGMMITGRPKCLVAALIGADDLRVYKVQRDEELITEIRRRVLEFWVEHVQKRIPPAPQTIRDTNTLLQKFGGFVSCGSPAVWESIQRLRGIRKASKRLEIAEQRFEMEIKRALLVEAEALGVHQKLDKMTILGPDSKKMASLTLQKRAGYTVQPSEFVVLRVS